MEWKITTLEELRTITKHIYGSLKKDPNHATILALKGDLGSGKTAFTKELAKVLGVTEHVTSPTFVLAKTYPLKDTTFSNLIHIDAYRLEEGEDLNPIGFSDMLDDPNNLIVLEWPERVEGALPAWTNYISIKVVNGVRVITYGN